LIRNALRITEVERMRQEMIRTNLTFSPKENFRDGFFI
jgi:hypothetical protein